MTDAEQKPENTVAPEGEKADISPAAERVEALEAEVAQLKDRALRALADADNIRKRAQRDVEESTKYAISGFAKDLVGVGENLYRAMANIPEESRKDAVVKPLAEGVDMTLKELLSVFERYGIRRIDPMGDKFDPHYHQAVLQVDVPDSEAGTVVQVLQAGYVLHDRLLRPALVGVAKQPSSGEEPKRVDATA